jgi:hypothetical protein
MMPPNLPANDTHRPTAPRPVCVPRPPRPRTVTPAPKESTPPKPKLVTQASAPPPAPRRLIAKPSTKPPPPLPPVPSRTPPPLPQPAPLTDADLVDDEDTVQAPRAPFPTSEDVDFDCFTLSEPPPESRPQRKRAWLAGITGIVLITLTAVVLLARPVTNGAVRPLNPANGAAARAPAILAVAPHSTSSVGNAAQKTTNSTTTTVSAGARAKLSAHGKSVQTTVTSAKKLTKRAAPRALPTTHKNAT